MAHEHRAFGDDAFGRAAERAARFFGTPQYIVGQTIVVIVWIVLNGVGIVREWDPYPFILLNLAFSTQAAYAAPLILLAQTRQAERDHVAAEKDEAHRVAMLERLERRETDVRRQADELRAVLDRNTQLVEEIRARVG